MTTAGIQTPEFSRSYSPERIPPEGLSETITADESERAALSQRFDLASIEALRAEFHLNLVAGGPMVRLVGRLTADVTQTCVVTLDPVAAHVEEDFELLFGPEETYRPGQEVHLDLETADPPEPFLPDGSVDVGEVVAEQLSLALDPFPRKADAEVKTPKGVELGGPDTLPNTPFAALAGLKDKLR